MWSKVAVRVTSALIGAVFVLIVIFANNPFYLNIAISIVSLIGMHELYTSFSQQKKWPLIVLYYVFALMILSSLFIRDFNIINSDAIIYVLLTYLMLLCISAVLFNDIIKLNDILISFFSLVYSVVFTSHLALIRMLEHGICLIFIPLIGAWMTDTFAYFGGLLFGKHKLIPKISPNKTIEGSISGIIGCILMSFIFAYIISFFGYKTNYLNLGIIALTCSILSQFGDLTASMIKRECGVKDFGNIMPGHGGILDRIDSLIFISPIVYYILQIFEVVYK